MAELSKQALKVENNTEFPNNNNGQITPARLRTFNEDMIDSTVNQAVYNSDSASWNADIDALQNFSSSLDTNFASQAEFNSFTASADQRLDSLESATSSYATAAITASSLVTASFASQTLTFTKGDGSTFGITIPDVSGSTIPAGTISGSQQITDLGFVSSSVTASSLTTASFAAGTLTFEKGDGTTFGVVIPDVSGSTIDTGSFATTGSNTFTGIQNFTSEITASNTLISGDLVVDPTTSTKLNGNTDIGSFLYVGGGLTLNNTAAITWLGSSPIDSTFSASVDARINAITGSGGSVPAGTVSSSAQILDYGIFATTGSNNFSGNQTVNGFVSASNGFESGPNTTALLIGENSNMRFYSGSNNDSYYNVQLVPGVGDIAFSRGGAGNVKVMTLAGVEGNATTFQNNPVQIQGSVTALTINAQSTAISGSGSYSVEASTITETATSATIAASASVLGTFGLTGQSSGDGKAILLGHSGSLVIGNSTTNTYYAAMGHISSSQANANTNLIFKNSTTAADTIVSGSANIFANPAAPTSGFKRYVGTSNIYTHGSSVPQISGSMAWSPSFNGNIFSHTQANALTWRGPTTLTTGVGQVNHNIFMAGQLNMGTDATNNAEKLVNGVIVSNNAIFGGNINVTAYKTTVGASPSIAGNLLFGAGVTLNHHSSSAINYTSNIQNGGITLNNEYEPTAGSITPSKTARASLNTVYGHQHVLTFKGTNTSTTQTKHFYANILAGMFLSSSVETGDSGNVLATGILGNSLIVSGSSTAAAANAQYSPNDTQGSVFVGRFNAVDGNKAKTAETVFAVGTGTAANRKTGFLIDSGSNTFIEGSLTVSGSLNFNGSSQFNVGGFQSNVSQSGSAGVSQSIQFDVTDVSYGVSMVNGSQMTFANAGVYSLTFSAQLEADAGADTVWIWFKKNGTNIAESATKMVLANNAAQLMTVNIVNEVAAGDYIELAWQSLNGDAILLAEAASGNIPSIPAVIFTATQCR